jgi:hypothetical protein
VTLLIKPCGRGNFSAVTMTLEGKHAGVFAFMHGLQVGARFDLAGVTWRVMEVRP